MMASLIGRPCARATPSSCMFIRKPPSPLMETTTASVPRSPKAAPMAAGKPKPIVPSPPDVMWLRVRPKPKCWAAHIWCWPTSVVSTPLSPAFSPSLRIASTAPRGPSGSPGGVRISGSVCWRHASMVASQGSVSLGSSSGAIWPSTVPTSPRMAQSA